MHMKTILMVIIASVMLVFVPVLSLEAGAASQPKGDFAKLKDMRLKKLEERIAVLKDEIACIQAATRYEELQACREKSKEGLSKPHEKK